MGKSLLGIHHQIEKKKPVYQAIKRVMAYYQVHPQTPGHKAVPLKAFKDNAEKEMKLLEYRQAEELTVILKKIEALRLEAKELAKVHQQQEEDFTTGVAKTELDFLEGRIDTLPESPIPVNSRPAFWIRWTQALIEKWGGLSRRVINKPLE